MRRDFQEIARHQGQSPDLAIVLLQRKNGGTAEQQNPFRAILIVPEAGRRDVLAGDDSLQSKRSAAAGEGFKEFLGKGGGDGREEIHGRRGKGKGNQVAGNRFCHPGFCRVFLWKIQGLLHFWGERVDFLCGNQPPGVGLPHPGACAGSF